jgi:hypothetical protein
VPGQFSAVFDVPRANPELALKEIPWRQARTGRAVPDSEPMPPGNVFVGWTDGRSRILALRGSRRRRSSSSLRSRSAILASLAMKVRGAWLKAS